jgi:hypothetical protein
MRKIYTILIICFSSAILFSCMSTKYIKTGEELSPLSWNDEIIIYDTSKPEKHYQKIGLLRISGGDKQGRIEKAKLFARKKGGDAIIVRDEGIITDPETGDTIKETTESSHKIQEFVIIKLSGDVISASLPEKGKDEEGAETGPGEESEGGTGEVPGVTEGDTDLPSLTGEEAGPDIIDYSGLPRATYGELVNNYKTLEGKKFRGALIPKKIYKVPASLETVAGTDDRLVMLTTKSGRSRLFMLINKSRIPDFVTMIKAGETLEFVYSPAGVYSSGRADYPVLHFIEEIK